MANKLQLSESQLTGFNHGYYGFDIVSLAESMGLKKSEWLKIREKGFVQEKLTLELDKHFKLNNNG